MSQDGYVNLFENCYAYIRLYLYYKSSKSPHQISAVFLRLFTCGFILRIWEERCEVSLCIILMWYLKVIRHIEVVELQIM